MAKTHLKLHSTTHHNHANKVPPFQYHPEIKVYRFLVKGVVPYVLVCSRKDYGQDARWGELSHNSVQFEHCTVFSLNKLGDILKLPGSDIVI